MRLLGLCGAIGAGKTTAARSLVARHGFFRVPFAAPLKAMLLALGLPAAALEGAAKEAPHPFLAGRTPRQAMQWLGTEWGRDLIGPDFWVAAWRARLTPLAPGGVVADDVRFANEAAAIRALGGLIVEITRPGLAPRAAALRARPASRERR
jgi:hypothetical protein